MQSSTSGYLLIELGCLFVLQRELELLARVNHRFKCVLNPSLGWLWLVALAKATAFFETLSEKMCKFAVLIKLDAYVQVVSR